MGWIALGIGFGLVVLANILTDSDLEYYFKHFVLCEKTKFDLDSNESPMQYNRRIFKKRATLVDYSEDDIRNALMHPTDAIATLHDLTVCNTIQYHIPRDGYGDKIGSGHAAYRLGYEVTISINFNQFLENKDQLEAVGVLLNSRGNDIGPFDLVVKQTEVTILENGQKQLNATLALPDGYKNKVNRHSNLVVALRICIDKETNHYFPHPMKDGLSRYIGACIGLRHGNAGTRDQKIIFEAKEKLKNEDIW